MGEGGFGRGERRKKGKVSDTSDLRPVLKARKAICRGKGSRGFPAAGTAEQSRDVKKGLAHPGTAKHKARRIS